MKIPPGTPEPLTTSWGPHLDAGRWFKPTPEVSFATSQVIEQLETAFESEEDSEVGNSSEEDTTIEDDSECVPATENLEREATADSEHEATADSEREARRQAAMRQMYRFDRAQVERRDDADMRESLARILPRGPLWQP